MSDVQTLKKRLESRIKNAERVIASKQATIARAKVDLDNLEQASARLEKQRQARAKKSDASPAIQEVKSNPKPNAGVNDKIEIPTMEMDLPAPAAPAAEKKEEKKSWLNPFV